MSRLPMLFGLVILGVALLVGASASQDAKKDKDEKTKKIKGSIPQGWKALKLSKDQTDKIHAIDVDYKTKIAELDLKIAELKQTSRIEMTKVLNADQKSILAKLSGLEEKDKKDGDKDKTKDKVKDK
jgi:TolA-binding protein